jgi:hypothetical protein
VEPFKITCVSCRAVLTVRKESMIGQIIACPRCSMMVQVLPPAGFSAVEKSAAETATVAPDSPATPAPAAGQAAKAATVAAVTTLFETTDALADAPPPTAPIVPAAHDPIFAATFDDAVDALSDPPAAAPSTPIPSGVTQAPASPVRPAQAAATVPPAAPPVLTATATRWAALKFPLMIAGGALAGAAMVATALTLLSSGNSAPQVAASATPPAANSPPPSATDATDATDAKPAEPAPAAETTPPPADVATTDREPAAQATRAESPADETPLADRAPAAPDAAADSATVAEQVVAEEIVARAPDSSVTETTSPNQPRLRIDPLEIDPEGLNLTTLYNGPSQDPLAASQLPGETVGAELSVPTPEEAPPEAAELEVDAGALGAVRRDEQAAGAPVGDVAALLARKTPGLKVQNMPLCRLLDLSVQLSGVPVSVAPEQLRLAAVSAGQPATAELKDATLEEFLTAALKPLRLKPVVADGQIRLVRGAGNSRSTRTFPVDDLAGDDDAVERLVATIEKVIAPDAWQAAGGSGSIAIDGKQLKIETEETVHYDVLLFLERARAALGKSPRSKYPATLIGADAAPFALARRLSAPATFTFSQYAPLREIFRHWQEEMQVAVLVDWPALADLRLWPNTRIACSSADKPWDAALDQVLTPLGLAWRPIDKLTIEITTLEKAAAAPLLEIYRLDPDALAEIENLTGELDQVALAAGATAGAGMSNALIGEHALLVSRQPAIAQRAIAKYLAGKGLLAAK